MDDSPVRKPTPPGGQHWWLQERRALLTRELARIKIPGIALNIGATGADSTQGLRSHRWQYAAIAFGPDGVRAAHGRGANIVRADARRPPIADSAVDLVVTFDVPQYIVEDGLALAEMLRVLRPDGAALITVSYTPRLPSARHVRRYTPHTLQEEVKRTGSTTEIPHSRNVLLQPMAAQRPTSSPKRPINSPMIIQHHPWC